ncbi:putative thioredoxin-like ferredoxin [Lupinus albus]|uniref:Putative thioredoxin-like ferredoxin n=1 Tax=Lupinus albus TaxID=3870 RepID=A0A6A4P981_LUPAL|nr:putative thioredoxin-like ferredoxin [Lupinus albus]
MCDGTCLTICEGDDETEVSNGDLLIFPDMIRYRLTHFDVESFVEEVLVNGGEWLPGKPEALEASYVFVCSHGSHDRRCGVCGPILVSRFREEVELYGLQGKVFVSPCSNIGGHHDAGNVIIFGSSINGKVTGHWYGYVALEDVSVLIQQHIIKGKILESLWRGQMGLSKNEQKKSQEQRLQLNGKQDLKESTEMLMQMKDSEISTAACQSPDNLVSCCQENDDSAHYQNTISRINREKRASYKFRSMSMELDSWEREDTYAAIAVVCAAASVAFAYSCYKQL